MVRAPMQFEDTAIAGVRIIRPKRHQDARGFFSEIMRAIDPSTIVAVTADHSTSCVRRAHTAEPVPLVASGGGIASDGSTTFGERSCATGSLGQLRGVDILPRLTSLMAS